MKEHRPSPEKLLKQVQEEERQEKRGKLKIYLGAAPGVGKTFTMLRDALEKRAQGLDVVIGIVESHGRKEIKAMMKELETLPLQEIEYREKKLSDFNLDATLKRNPGLILIDEMAHTNAPNLRHTKRWQDIKEILDRGIDVYTTLNVQHIDSLNDVVAQIIHNRITETVPDSMIEMADTIELVDLPPEDLLQRLHEGKVYFPQQAELAIENFFRKGNLIALRELALRVTAERVGAQVILYRQDQNIKHIWPTKEKILVCVGSGPQSAKAIRTARRMATSLQAEWTAVHIDTPYVTPSDEQRNYTTQNLRLAEQLGAETRTLTGFDIVKEIMSFCREQNITKIIIGKRVQPRLRDFLFRNLADEIVRSSGEIDVYIIHDRLITSEPLKTSTTTPRKPVFSWAIYGITAGIVMLATAIDSILYPYLHASNLILIYLLGVTFVALFGQMGPAIFASVLSVLAYKFFFIPPFFTFLTTDLQYVLTLVVMLLVSQIISHLTIMTRRQTEIAQLTEKRTATLHALSRQLASTRGVDKLLETAVSYISDVFDSEVLALLPEDNHLKIRARYRTEKILTEKEQGVAQWVYDLGQMAGLGTDTLPYSDAIYVPLFASKETIGVLRVRPLQLNQLFSSDQMHMLEACAHQVALALEVDRLQEQAKKSELQTETDRARSALLQSVSHDLRTPLAAVMGAANTLIEMSHELDAEHVKKFGKNIYFESEQLNRLINNLLQMTYLEAESVHLQKEPGSLQDVIQLVIHASNKKLGSRPILVHLPENLPAVPFDHTLIQEVFINLIDNAMKFTPPLSPIEISAVLERDKVIVSVEDNGPGIVADEVNFLFEKFYRGRMLTTERGLGLGLAICRSIIKAHGGEIWAENRPAKGAAFRFSLPLH